VTDSADNQVLLEARRRFRRYSAGTAALAVALVVILVVGLTHRGSSTPPPVPVAPSVLHLVTSVPSSVADQAGRGSVTTGVPATISGAELRTGGKPQLLFIGGEFCPFCAADRWAIVNTLSRFGTVRGLSQIRSSEDGIATFSFRHASFTSPVLSFAGREVEDQRGHQLMSLTVAQHHQWTTYLAPGASRSAFPFLSVAGRYVSTSTMVDPRLLLGKTWQQIAAAVSDPSSAIGQSVLGAANYLTAALCQVTGNQPASACTPTVQELAGSLAAYHH
jgi:hypothetical protein